MPALAYAIALKPFILPGAAQFLLVVGYSIALCGNLRFRNIPQIIFGITIQFKIHSLVEGHWALWVLPKTSNHFFPRDLPVMASDSHRFLAPFRLLQEDHILVSLSRRLAFAHSRYY